MGETATGIREGHEGDVVVVSGHRVGERERTGEILEVVGSGDHVHYRVRWEDGRETLFYPGSDAHVRHAEPAKRRS